MLKQTLVSTLGALALMSGGCNTKKSHQTTQEDTTIAQTRDTTKLFPYTSTRVKNFPEMIPMKDTCVDMHKSFWRELEFVSKDQKIAIDKEFANIQDVYDNHKIETDSSVTFTKVVFREQVSQPLSVNLSKFKSYFPGNYFKFFGLQFKNNPLQVKNGIYFGIEGITLYGLLEGDTIKTLGIYYTEGDYDIQETTNNFIAFMASEKLYLVDWKERKLYDEKTIDKWFAE